jgi:antitoxin HicB
MNNHSEKRLSYPALFEVDDELGSYVVSFRDIPEALTAGDDEMEAVSMAEEVLSLALSLYARLGKCVPAPSSLLSGERLITAHAALPGAESSTVNRREA